MEKNHVIESFGLIIKEELVCSLTSNVLENTLVLESMNPFPGYYGKNIPDTEKPRSLFLILNKKYDYLRLGRILKNIRSIMEKEKPCNPAIGTITIDGRKYYCIRIRNLDCFEFIIDIQKKLQSHGISMLKYHYINTHGIIQIHKPFLLKNLSDDFFYKDETDPHHFYFKISHEQSWEQFKKITDAVKNNIDQNIFDSAMVVLWKMEGPIDLVRIYEKNPSIERLSIIRERYEYELRK